ncbi:condensation protein [Streptomyces pseudovenezuelae]|uniref:condensation protein n=1 Tax=Streptomyces pseudovenezuelae TaxID=67350 RepID=UPI002E32559F|nr:condensation protein [Streptomyces pseudovenezuelae]
MTAPVRSDPPRDGQRELLKPARRIPFGPVDEVSRHWIRETEPESVHIEVHLSGRPEPARLRQAFAEAMRRHPRVLLREAPGHWYRRRYEWEVTRHPDADPVHFPPSGPGALASARTRALSHCPALSASPPLRLEVVDPGPDADGCVLVLTLHHTAFDAPTGLRLLATTAEVYGGVDNEPAPIRTGHVRSAPEAVPPAPRGRPARVAAHVPPPDQGARLVADGLALAELPVPARPPRDPDGPAPHTVNDQLLVASSLTVTRWNQLQGSPARPVWLNMPVDDRPRGPHMPMGNGTRMLRVPVSPQDPADEPRLAADPPDPDAVARLLRQTALRTRALKAARPGPPLGRSAALLTLPVLPVGARRAVARGVREAGASHAPTMLVSNLGRVPYPLHFGDAGRARAVWFSGPARRPTGLSLTVTGAEDRLRVALRWSRALFDDKAGACLSELFARSLHATSWRGPDAHRSRA